MVDVLSVVVSTASPGFDNDDDVENKGGGSPNNCLNTQKLSSLLNSRNGYLYHWYLLRLYTCKKLHGREKEILTN